MPGLLSGLLRRVRLNRVSSYIQGDVLDLGCGDGHVLERFQESIRTYCGVDLSGSAIRRLKSSYPEHEFCRRDIDDDDLALGGRRFDVVAMIAVVEHLYNLKRVFEIAAASLRPDGRIVITTPTPFGNDVVHRLGAKIGLFSRTAADGHIVIFNRKRFQILAGRLGLDIERYERFSFGCNQLVVLRLAKTRRGHSPRSQDIRE